MAINTLDGVIAGLRPTISFGKASVTSEGAGTFHSLWKVAGFPGAGSTPPAFGSGGPYVPDNTTPGCLPFTNPVSGFSYLAGLSAACGVAGTMWLYDRAWHCSGFATNVTTQQNITTPGNVGRYSANPVCVEIWGEVNAAPGATGATWTVSYTNQDGIAGRTATYTHPANAETVGQMLPFALQAGDIGVQSVQSFACSVSSGTAGDIGIVLLRRAKMLPMPLPGIGSVLDVVGVGMARLLDGVCLALMLLCSNTTTGLLVGEALVTQG